MSTDLLLRYLIIAIAFNLACAWIQSFQSPWPLVDAFKLANSAEEQLLQSLGISFNASAFTQVRTIIGACSEAVCLLCPRSLRDKPSMAALPMSVSKVPLRVTTIGITGAIRGY